MFYSNSKNLSVYMWYLDKRGSLSVFGATQPPSRQAPLSSHFKQSFPPEEVSQEGKGKRKDLSKLREGTMAVSQDPSSAKKDK